MKLRPRDRVKLINDTVLFVSFMAASATGTLKMPALVWRRYFWLLRNGRKRED